MGFNGTPRDLAYTAGKWLTIFIGSVVLLYIAEASWFFLTVEDEEMNLKMRLATLPTGMFFYLGESNVLRALGPSIVAWMVVFPGLFLANGAQRIAAIVFGFATLTAVSGLSAQYWFATVPSVLAIGYLTIWAWTLRNQIPVVTNDAARAAELIQQRQALLEREIGQEDVISRK